MDTRNFPAENRIIKAARAYARAYERFRDKGGGNELFNKLVAKRRLLLLAAEGLVDGDKLVAGKDYHETPFRPGGATNA